MNTEEKKKLAAKKAIQFVPQNKIIGVGTGSTVNYFIEFLEIIKDNIKGAVSTSKQTTRLLKNIGIEVIDVNQVTSLPVYIDGADEVNHLLEMIKGGGGALLAEKIVANISEQFICIADDSKYIMNLGNYPVAIEVIPEARSSVAREILRLGGAPQLRVGFVTERGNEILDVKNLNLDRPIEMEEMLNKIVGVVENGIFAKESADILILGRDNEAEIIKRGSLV